MTKICHMTSAHYSLDERIFYKQCVSLACTGYETYIVAQGESFDRSGVKIVGVGKLKSGRLTRFLKAAREVYKKALEIDADIYHIHDPELLPYALKLKRKKKKVIFDSHEDIAEQIKSKEWIPVFVRKLVANRYLSYQNTRISRFDAIISVTPHICDKLKKSNSNTVLITNYPIIKKDDFENNYNKGLTEENDNRLICFAGGVDKQWSHEYIIKALDAVTDVKYAIYGTASDNFMTSLSTISGFEKVIYYGKIPHEQVRNKLKKAAVGIAICQISGNMGGKLGTLGNTKIFEYMIAELPVICSDFDLWKDIIYGNNCGICVDPTDIDEISKAINYLLDNPDIAKQMGLNGRRAILEKYNWGIEEKKLLKLYEELSK